MKLFLFTLFSLLVISISAKEHPRRAEQARKKKVPYLTLDELVALREETREMFFFGFNKYMDFGFPWDELKPLSCEPRRWDQRERGGVDDILGGYALTLVDSLDSMAVMGEVDKFFVYTKLVADTVSFDRDVVVSVFEVIIRIVGGLLSAHLIAVGPFSEIAKERNYIFHKDDEDRTEVYFKYNNELLDLAIDIADRLMPAFDSPTDMPYYSVNLKHGAIKNVTTNAITSDVGTMIIELTTLSRISGNPYYETLARRSLRSLYSRRTRKDLFAISIDVDGGRWTSHIASVGPGVDSFFEYLMKAYYAFGDQESLEMFTTAYKAVKRNMQYGPWQLEVDVYQGNDRAPYSYIISSLAAFWSGVQVSAGDIGDAVALHSQYMQLWLNYQALPESYDLVSEHITANQKRNPLRPEFIESTFHLYQATHDPFYLKAGRRMMFALQNRTRVDCGFAGIRDVEKKLDLEDRMDSYFFAETLKYMYMLFDMGIQDATKGVAQFQEEVCAEKGEDEILATNQEHGWLTWGDPNAFFFSTEGHIFRSDAKGLRENFTPVSEFQRVGTKEYFFSNTDLASEKGVCYAIQKKKKW